MEIILKWLCLYLLFISPHNIQHLLLTKKRKGKKRKEKKRKEKKRKEKKRKEKKRKEKKRKEKKRKEKKRKEKKEKKKEKKRKEKKAEHIKSVKSDLFLDYIYSSFENTGHSNSIRESIT